MDDILSTDSWKVMEYLKSPLIATLFKMKKCFFEKIFESGEKAGICFSTLLFSHENDNRLPKEFIRKCAKLVCCIDDFKNNTFLSLILSQFGSSNLMAYFQEVFTVIRSYKKHNNDIA